MTEKTDMSCSGNPVGAGTSTAAVNEDHNPDGYRRRRSSVKETIDDKLLAYEREPVPAASFKGWLSFLGMFISRHTAGTEFAIGPMFVANGATAIDVVVGLFLGNILATLSWRFLVAPLATSQRLTTYYAMELVVGKRLMYVYDLLACVLLAGLAGAMFTVSATAFGAISDVPMPGLDDWLPNSWAFVGIVIGCGLVTTIIAAFGFTFVTTFGELMTPVLIAGIIYLCVQSLQMLGINDECSFWCIMTDKVYAGEKVDPNQPTFGFGRCLAFAWFVDLQLHIGQNDLSLLRFAKSPNIGWASAGGMFIGHYFAWIVAGLMYAVQLQETGETAVAPGPIAELVGGGFGISIIIIAGWSTANPVLYSSGLAFQHMFPQIRAWLSTIIVGALATVAACFPALTNKIMEFLSLAGVLLCPMGIMVFTDYFIFPRLNLPQQAAKASGTETTTNWPAAFTWALTEIIALPLGLLIPSISIIFAPFIAIPLAFTIYIASTKISVEKGWIVSILLEVDEETTNTPPIQLEG